MHVRPIQRLLVAWVLAGLGSQGALDPLSVAAQSQDPRESRSAAALTGDVPRLITSPAPAPHTVLTVRWLTGAGASADALVDASALPLPGGRFQLLSRRVQSFEPVVDRDPQLSANDLVVVAMSDTGQEVGWVRVKDPRIVRAEAPGADGVLTGQTLYRTDTELQLWLPARTDAAALRIYKPEWNGQEYLLVNLGTLSLR